MCLGTVLKIVGACVVGVLAIAIPNTIIKETVSRMNKFKETNEKIDKLVSINEMVK